ncbi:MAG: hypothetical protein Sylvanvirus31_6 [Sylvanvirus sp.]|uniref:Uncharacterized protein n=1 Tax=Sylvanvirus sp. TaxID=2487774 RepID=A0A3G5AIZ5_9VIRU|nr:MAG: hypothetical protein Sylvanvirus31_6 [Sylvanvirus sp.]
MNKQLQRDQYLEHEQAALWQEYLRWKQEQKNTEVKQSQATEPHETVLVGTFDISSSRLVVIDPAWTASTKGIHVNVENGKWNVKSKSNRRGVPQLTALLSSYQGPLHWSSQAIEQKLSIFSDQLAFIDSYLYQQISQNESLRYEMYDKYSQNKGELIVDFYDGVFAVFVARRPDTNGIVGIQIRS